MFHLGLSSLEPNIAPSEPTFGLQSAAVNELAIQPWLFKKISARELNRKRLSFDI